jgi:hypothetical protein
MVIDTVTDTLTDTIPLNHAFAAAVDPFLGTVYVDGNGVVSVISAGGPKILRDHWEDPWGDFREDHWKR